MAVIKKFRIKSFKEQETLLQLEKISMFYDKRRILNDISFRVNRSEVRIVRSKWSSEKHNF